MVFVALSAFVDGALEVIVIDPFGKSFTGPGPDSLREEHSVRVIGVRGRREGTDGFADAYEVQIEFC